ncbi:MAG: hypothetical protein ACOYJA_13435 [Christensenellales bacterium]|jgi:hypothetical protein
MKPLEDYTFVRGFNYTQSNVITDTNFWEEYDHDIVERDMGYAERLRLNSARIFLTYSSYVKDPEGFLRNVQDFMDTAWRHGISTNPIVYHGLRFHPDDLKPGPRDRSKPPKTLLDESCWALGERYFDALYEAVGSHPGLLFWDISNEPGYRLRNDCTWYEAEPAFRQTGLEPPDPEQMEDLRYRQELVWKCIRHFCKYVKGKDPVNAIGVGNTFIYETEASGTAELVDIIVFHDYSETRARAREVYEYAMALGKKYGKPVINNETCCLCRANPYDMVLELISQYKMGWYAFELMIGADLWNRVHGVVYPDGTVRDPAIVSALMGFYRNRGQHAIAADVNQEGHAQKAIAMAERALARKFHGFTHVIGDNAGELLEACEYIANLLEAGQHVPMDNPPTARVMAYRRQAHPDVMEIRRWLVQLVGQLKQACDII